MLIWLKEKIFESPLFQLIIEFLLTTSVGIFSGTFVTEITIDGQISWKNWYQTNSLYILVGIAIIYFFYKRFLYIREKEVMQFLDKDYCIAYARSQMLPEMAKKAKEQIRNGKGGEFKDAMDEIKKVLK